MLNFEPLYGGWDNNQVVTGFLNVKVGTEEIQFTLLEYTIADSQVYVQDPAEIEILKAEKVEIDKDGYLLNRELVKEIFHIRNQDIYN